MIFVFLASFVFVAHSTQVQCSDATFQQLSDSFGNIPQLRTAYGWFSNCSVCEWGMVTCVGGAITKIKHTAGGFDQLTGTIDWTKFPPTLEELDFDWQAISGTIDLTQLPSGMKKIQMLSNRLVGSVVLTQLPATLTNLELDFNRGLNGTLNLTQLPPAITHLGLRRCSFTGTIDLTRLGSTIYNFLLEDNKLEGTVDLTKLPRSLALFYLGGNRFTGTVDLTKMTDMFLLQLQNNMFSGTVDLTQLPSRMWHLELQGNNFVGPVRLDSLPANINLKMDKSVYCDGVGCTPSVPGGVSGIRSWVNCTRPTCQSTCNFATCTRSTTTTSASPTQPRPTTTPITSQPTSTPITGSPTLPTTLSPTLRPTLRPTFVGPTIQPAPLPERCGCPVTKGQNLKCSDYQCRVMSNPASTGWRRYFYAQCTDNPGGNGINGDCICPPSVDSRGTSVPVIVAPCLCCQVKDKDQCRRTAVIISSYGRNYRDCCRWNRRTNSCQNPSRAGSCENVKTVDPVTVQPVVPKPPTYGLVMQGDVMCSIANSKNVSDLQPTNSTTFCSLNWAFTLGPRGGWELNAPYVLDVTGCVNVAGSVLSVRASFELFVASLSDTQLQALRGVIDRFKRSYGPLQQVFQEEGVAVTCTIANYQCRSVTNGVVATTTNTGACNALGVIPSSPGSRVKIFSVVLLAFLCVVLL